MIFIGFGIGLIGGLVLEFTVAPIGKLVKFVKSIKLTITK